MSKQDIKAGKAVIEVSILDKVRSGLLGIQKRLNTWAQGLAIAGSAATGAGGGILGSLLGAVTSFVNTGSELADMSARTGVAAESLQELGFAAKQSGAEMSDLESGLRNMAKFEHKLAGGSKQASQTLDDLGISAAQFRDASTTQQMAMLAEGLNKIQDPSERAALAMQVLGKSGTKLLPMLSGGAAGVQQMVDRARELNIVMSEEQVAKADLLGDKWGELEQQLWAIANNVGAALADTLIQIIDLLIEGAKGVIAFVQHNEWLVVMIAAAGAGILAFGGFLLGLSATAWLTSAAIGGISTAITIFNALVALGSGLLAMLLTPLGSIAAALLVGGVAWLVFSDAGQRSMGYLTEGLWSMLGTARQTFQGVFDALASGNWSLAGQIAMAGLYAVWVEGVNRLKMVWGEFKTWIITTILSALSGVVAKLNEYIGSEFLGQLVKDIDHVKLGVEISKDASLDKAKAEIAKAKSDLEKLTSQASSERAKQEADRIAAFKKKHETALPNIHSAQSDLAGDTGKTLGTFSSFVTGLLGRSAPGENHAAKTATNTGKMVDHLESIDEKLEEMEGLEFQ